MEKNSKKNRTDATPTPATAEDTKRRPEKVFRLEDVSASLWKRDHMVRGQLVTFRSATFERSYRDANGKWNYTRNFDVQDLAKLITVANQVNEYITSLPYDEADAVPGK